MNEKTLAKFFYEQCAGSTSGHMAMVPNNPTLFALIKAGTGSTDNCYAASQTEFALMLRNLADALSEPEKSSLMCYFQEEEKRNESRS